MKTYTPESLGITASTTGGQFKQGGWYSGRQYWNGSLGEVNQIHPESDQQGAGQQVSSEVISQTNPANLGYINSQIKANEIKSPAQISYTSSNSQNNYMSGLSQEVANARKSIEETIGKQKLEIDTKATALRQKEQETLGKIGELSTPFREDLEKTQREQLHINQNFEANQALVDELDSLLTQGNNLIKQQQEVTGLASIRNPRVQKTMDDVTARAGVIQAVINARNGQIAVAENMIDRTISAIAGDRQDQISYYETILSLDRQDIISLEADSRKLAEEQINLKKGDLETAQAAANYIKQMLMDPDKAALLGQAGVKLTDSVETINAKITQATYYNEIRDLSNSMALEGNTSIADPTGVPSDRLITYTDSRGEIHYYKKPVDVTPKYTTNSQANSWLETSPPIQTNQQSNQQNNQLYENYDSNIVNSLWDDILTPSNQAGSSAQLRG